MTKAQKTFIEIQKRQSTLRGEFNTLRAVETRSAEQDTRLTALDGELTESETEFRTAADALLTEQTTTAAPGGEDTEARERRELCDRANVGDVFGALIEKRQTDGATAEVQAAHGCAPNQIPIAMLRTEVRAVTPTPGASQTEQAETVQPVFATGAGAFLGYRPAPTVAMGQAVYPVLTSRPSRVKRAVHAEATTRPTRPARSRPTCCRRRRIQASFIYRRTDAMQFSGMDSALRMALNSGLQEKLDLDLIAGTEGLLTGSNLGNHNVTNVTTFALYLSQLSFQPRRWPVCGHEVGYPGAYGLWDLRARGRRLSVVQPTKARCQRLNRSRAACACRLTFRPWRAIVRTRWYGSGCSGMQSSRSGARSTIIVDEVTLSGKGEIEVTAVLGMNTKILRAAGFLERPAQSQHQ